MKEREHEHKGTHKLKVIIFSLLMLAPCLAILSSCCYASFNKNAEEKILSYETKQPTTLETNKTYHFKNTARITFTGTSDITFATITNIVTNIEPSTDVYNRKTIGVTDDYSYLCANGNVYNYFIGSFDFTIQSYTGNAFNQYITYEEEITEVYTINTFYYSIEKVKQSDLFNWTLTTGTYTACNSMCSGLGVTNSIIPMLLAYWLLLTAVYVVIDIVTNTFEYLTHMFNWKN